MDVTECAKMLADLTIDGRKILQEHLNDFNGILLHILVEDLVTEPLISLLQSHQEKADLIEIYVKAIEDMWKNGNDEAVNVVDVTILERLSDEEDVWQKFGTYISNEFKNYINEEVLKWNMMMSGVKALG